jgi:hypothetical protein
MSQHKPPPTTATREDPRLRATQAVLRDREAELLALKGPCSNRDCRLHHAHSGPCDTTHGGTEGR